MKKIAIIIGHSEDKQGAVNKSTGMTEFAFNEPIAYAIANDLMRKGFDALVMYRKNGYSALPSEINETKADLAIELHCNAFNESASGHEVLAYHTSTKGIDFATKLNNNLQEALNSKDRGVKKITASENGGYLLQKTAMPCVISEPLFIDSDADLKNAMNFNMRLIMAHVKAVVEYFEVLR